MKKEATFLLCHFCHAIAFLKLFTTKVQNYYNITNTLY